MSDTVLSKKVFFKDSVIYLASAIISTTIGFITLPIYTRFLAPSDYGIVVLFLMFGGVVTSLLSIGLNSASYRYYFEYKNDPAKFKSLNSTNLTFNIVFFIFAAIFICQFADLIALKLFGGKVSGSILKWSFLSGCLNYFYSYLALLLTALLRSKLYALITVVKIIIDTILSFYFIFGYSLTYMARIYGIVLSQVITVIWLIIFLRKFFCAKFSFFFLKKSLKYSYPTLPGSVMGLVYQSFDKTMLTNYKDLTAVGYYSFGEKFANMLKMALDSIEKVWSPFFMHKSSENTNEAKAAIVGRFYKLTFLFMVVALVITYFSEEMIKLLTTKEYYPSMYVTPLFVFYYLFGATNKISINQIMFGEKLLFLVPSTAISLFINIILNILLIPKFGAVGAALATAIAAMSTDMALLFLGQKAYPLPIRKWELLGIFAIFFAFVLPVYPIMAANINFIVKILLKIFIFSLYISLGFKMGFIKYNDLVKLKAHLFKRKRNKLDSKDIGDIKDIM